MYNIFHGFCFFEHIFYNLYGFEKFSIFYVSSIRFQTDPSRKYLRDSAVNMYKGQHVMRI